MLLVCLSLIFSFSFFWSVVYGILPMFFGRNYLICLELSCAFSVFFVGGVIYFTAHLGESAYLSQFYRFPSFSFYLCYYLAISASI